MKAFYRSLEILGNFERIVKTNWINKFEGIFGNVGNLERIWKEIARNSKEFEGMRKDFERTFEGILKGFEKKGILRGFTEFWKNEKLKKLQKHFRELERNFNGIYKEFYEILQKKEFQGLKGIYGLLKAFKGFLKTFKSL